MPGTWGSLVAIPLILIYAFFPVWMFVLLTLIGFIAGIYICDRTCRDLNVHDHSAVVWDEIIGMLITFIAIPLSVLHILIGFLLFRFFDVVKPWPIRWLDRHVTGGLGVMVDDVLAGIFAWLGMQAVMVLERML
jgi:phosphatidylglycerophosphatase A